ncbi:MFS general substrate transporter [Jaminaea rosea]|uniref:MFS general substrate transporter n=1 Tax=Jaminaea rosea TaxID=1569628 RepID=A0A316UKR1_9BASI|nr:MFS general substrate transporter [Jaminaea rosea]PWN24961.1 MFS general substrate transporter [Jaminaea rosea]
MRTQSTSQAISSWILMLLPSALAGLNLVGAVFGYSSTSFALGPSWHDSGNLTALVRLYFIYSLILNINAAWLIASAVLWPLVHTRTSSFAKASYRCTWRRVSLAINASMLPLVIIFGACGLAYASKRVYDDAGNGLKTRRTTKDVEHAVTPDEKASPSAAPTPTQPGRAGWLCVLGSACCLFMGFGFLNAFGVLQQYYETTYLRGTSPSSISWIGSISTFLLFGGNLVAGVLMDRFGPRPLMGWLVVSYTVACMLTSLCKEYYQVLLAQGVLFGLAASCSFAVPLSCIMLHFKEKRGPAIGIVVATSSIGGVTWPFIIRALLNNAGFGWTWRAVGFIGLALLSIAFVTVTSPIRRSEQRAGPRQSLFYAPVLRSRPYLLLAASLFFSFLGIFYLFFYLPALTAAQGAPTELQFASISILNACSFFGRLGVPIPAPKLGALNLLTGCSAIAAIIVLASIGAQSTAGVLVVGGFYGFFSGGIISLFAACVGSITPDLRRIGSSVGQMAGLLAVAALLGSPIAGWIIDSRGGYKAAAGFSGGCLALGAILAFAARLAQESNLRKPA